MNDDWLTDDRGRIISLSGGESENRSEDQGEQTDQLSLFGGDGGSEGFFGLPDSREGADDGLGTDEDVFGNEGVVNLFSDEVGEIGAYEDPIEGREPMVRERETGIQEVDIGGLAQEDLNQRQRAGRAAAREQQSIESHAIKGAKQGNQEAINALVDEAGWNRSEAEALAGRVEDPRDGLTQGQLNEIVEVELVRARSNGRIQAKQPQDVDHADNSRSITSGRFVGSEFSEPDIGRNARTGRFVGGDR